MSQRKKTILYIRIGLIALILGFTANIALLMPNLGVGLTPDKFEPKTALIHGSLTITGNSELDAFCGGNETDGMSWDTAHVIENMWINADGSASGIVIADTTRYLIIKNCYVTNAGGSPAAIGIGLFNCSNVEIMGCGIEKNQMRGISVQDCDKISIINSEVLDNQNDGIRILNTNGCIVRNNHINDNLGVGLYIEFTEDNLIEDNLVTGNIADGMELYEMNSSRILNNIVMLNLGDGLDMWGGDSGNYNLISGNTFSNNSLTGIQFDDSNHHNVISNNEINYNGQDGIVMIDDQYNNTISGNAISENGESGIYIPQQETSYNCTIETNIIHKNANYGIESDYNANMTIIDNICTNNYGGIELDSAEGGLICGNTLAFNDMNGIHLDWCNDISVCGNNASFNQYGIELDTGSGNKFWLNYAANNSISNGEDGDPHIWDNGSIGNYWGDYLTQNPAAVAAGNIWTTNYTVSGPGFANDTKPMVEIDPAPVLTPSFDLVYTLNTTGNQIFCHISDLYNLIPKYSVTKEGVIVQTGVWMAGDNLSITVDGLGLGTHIYQITVRDGTAWGVSEVSIQVTVEEPTTPEEPEPEHEPEPTNTGNIGQLIGIFYWVGLGVIAIIVSVIIRKKHSP